MKIICLVLCFLVIIISSAAFSQSDTIKTGAYRNHIDFGKNKPMYESKFIFYKEYNKIIPELYSVSTYDPKVKKKAINKIIWGIYNGNSLFINVTRIGMINGYIRIEKLGIYSYFKGIPMMSISQQEQLNRSSYLFGATGAVIANAQISKENKNKIHYILNLETGMINLLTGNYLLMALEPYPELLNNYKSEENNESIEVLLKYIDLLNKEDVKDSLF